MTHYYTTWCLYGQTVFALVRADFVTFKKNFFNKLIDNTIVLIANLIVMGEILPYFGLAPNFDAFMLAGNIAAVGAFEAYSGVAKLISDIDSDKKIISYELTLPMPSWLTFMHTIISLASQMFIMSFFMTFFGMLFLGSHLPLAQISFIGLLIILVINNIFYATWCILITSMVKDITVLESAWTRFVFPLWIFGGFQFSWAALHAVFPRASYIGLLNPILYITEGFRDAMGIEGDFISLRLCLAALISFTMLFGWWGIKRLKKRLDYV